MSIAIEQDIKDIFNKIEQNQEKIFDRLEQIQISQAESRKDIQRLEDKIEGVEAKLSKDIQRLEDKIEGVEVKLGKDIQRLEDKIDAQGKRIDSVEFINRGIFVGLIITLLGGLAKMFSLFGNP